jgi:hypothetical protein
MICGQCYCYHFKMADPTVILVIVLVLFLAAELVIVVAVIHLLKCPLLHSLSKCHCHLPETFKLLQDTVSSLKPYFKMTHYTVRKI